MKAENTYEKPQIAKHLAPDSQTLATLEEQYTLNNIGKIISSHAGDREDIGRVIKLPITDLQEDKTNPYYCKLAIERKKDNENTNFVDQG